MPCESLSITELNGIGAANIRGLGCACMLVLNDVRPRPAFSTLCRRRWSVWKWGERREGLQGVGVTSCTSGIQNSTFFGEGELSWFEGSSSNVKDLLRVGLSASVSSIAVAMVSQTKPTATEKKEGEHQIVSNMGHTKRNKQQSVRGSNCSARNNSPKSLAN